jgi:sodium/potassium-transporting ATPase subunit alpha
VYANLLYILVPIPIPLTSVLILVVDLGFELIIALTYAWDPPENRRGLMKLQPRKPVTPASIERLRQKESNTGDQQLDEQKSAFSKWMPKFVADMFESSEEETLVDGNLLMWAYVEAGTIQTIGCLVAFFVALYYHRGITPWDATNYAEVWEKEPIQLANGFWLVSDGVTM